MRDPNVRTVLLGCSLMAISSSLVGSFALLRGRALVGDAVSHSVLPGICLGFLLAGTKSLPWILGGAFATAWLSLRAVEFITRRTRLHSDTAIAMVLSVFFGAGAMLLKTVQSTGNEEQSGLNSFLFGNAAAMMGQDVWIFSAVALLLILCVLLLYKEFSLLAFDPDFARVGGLRVRAIEQVLTTMTVLAIVVGIQAVGVVLMSAMLITPAAAARYLTRRLPAMLLVASAIAVGCTWIGAYISYQRPNMPTGPWIVVAASIVAFGAFLLSPRQGVVATRLNRLRYRKQIVVENVLKCLYMLGERDGQYKSPRTPRNIRSMRSIATWKLAVAFWTLRRRGLLWKAADGYRLTDKGLAEGKRLSRLHRLWEQYLSQYVGIAPDHVHEDAETMEHIITPELEKKLVRSLDFPETDPHQTQIPY